jgi:CubicO group peptidase (beta-lactamase class C family)
LHQARLQPFIQFYYDTRQPVFKNQALITSSLSDANPLKVGSSQYMNRYTNFRDNVIAETFSDKYPYQVADHIFISKSWPDSMYQGIAESTLRDKKEYLYSDLGFILFKQMVDSLTRVPFDHFIDSLFYSRLGANHLLFNPLKKFNPAEIAPTEDDQLFRHQLLRGYVHDQRAAMFGGVAGHAGLFGNALDLAKLFQMMLNEGEYGGERYISRETVELFTQKKMGTNGNRRTGFTGTMVWVDPEYDLVYVFLSNRVCPDANNNRLVEMNVRTQVQQVIYNAIMDK